MDEILQYQKYHPVHYPTVPPLKTKCSINYDWTNCSASEYGNVCRTCCFYNPLRMLYEQEANGTKIMVPRAVLLADCKRQLEKG